MKYGENETCAIFGLKRMSKVSRRTYLKTKDIKPVLEVPRGVEVCQRFKVDGGKILILINHETVPHKVSIPWMAYEHLSENTGSGELTLSPYGVAVLEQES